jgi:hypothetical protein
MVIDFPAQLRYTEYIMASGEQGRDDRARATDLQDARSVIPCLGWPRRWLRPSTRAGAVYLADGGLELRVRWA